MLPCLGLASIAFASEPFLLGGIQVNESDPRRWTGSLRQVGMNTVAATVYARQGDWDSDDLWFDEDDPAVLAEIRAAKEHGLRVALILRVALDHSYPKNEFLWHGMIMPGSPREIESWFEKYEAFAVHWARIAEREGVDVFGIGSEMKSLAATLPIGAWGNLKNYHGFVWHQRALQSRARSFAGEIESRHLWVRGRENYEDLESYLSARLRNNVEWASGAFLRDRPHRLEAINQRRQHMDQRWVRLIRAVRGVYTGRLTYGANFDNYRNVGFWGHLDYVGINSYFPLRRNLDEELDHEQLREVFTRSWEEIFDDIQRFQHRQHLDGMPVLFTEIGYTSRKNSSVQPWAHAGFSVVGWQGADRRLVVWDEQPPDPAERSIAIESLRAVHDRLGRGLLRGIFYWKLSTDRSHERIEAFVLHVGPDSRDPLQDALLGFLRN